MKVRSWKALMLHLVFGGGMMVFGFKLTSSGESSGLPYITVAFIEWIRFVPDAVSVERHDRNQLRAYAAQWYGRQQFGRFAPIVPWLGPLLIFLDSLLVTVLPITSALRVIAEIILGIAVLTIVLYGTWERRQVDGMDDEEEEQIRADYAVYQRSKRQLEAADRQRWGIFAGTIPALSAVLTVIGVFMPSDSEQTSRISILLVYAGVLSLFLYSLWKGRRIETWKDTGESDPSSDNSEQLL